MIRPRIKAQLVKKAHFLKKQASFSTAVGLHALQNALTHAGLKYGKKLGLYDTVLRNYINGHDSRPVKRSFFDGLKTVLSPEMRVIDKELPHYKQHVDSAMRTVGWDPDNLTNRQIVTLRRMLRGDFDKVMKQKGEHQDILRLLQPALEKTKYDNILTPENMKHVEDAAKQLSSSWKNNGFTGNLGRGLADRMTAENLRKIQADGLQYANSAKAYNGAALGTEAVGDALLAQIDPWAAAFNFKKRFVTWDKAAENPVLKKPLAWLKDFTTDAPIAKGFFRGQRGKDYLWYAGGDLPVIGPMVHTAHRYAGNMPLASVQQFSNDLGKTLRGLNENITLPGSVNKDFYEYATNKSFRKRVLEDLKHGYDTAQELSHDLNNIRSVHQNLGPQMAAETVGRTLDRVGGVPGALGKAQRALDKFHFRSFGTEAQNLERTALPAAAEHTPVSQPLLTWANPPKPAPVTKGVPVPPKPTRPLLTWAN